MTATQSGSFRRERVLRQWSGRAYLLAGSVTVVESVHLLPGDQSIFVEFEDDILRRRLRRTGLSAVPGGDSLPGPPPGVVREEEAGLELLHPVECSAARSLLSSVLVTIININNCPPAGRSLCRDPQCWSSVCRPSVGPRRR